jgi:peptidyl-prolyl cis-trans isomerase A (cyclophilin A)
MTVLIEILLKKIHRCCKLLGCCFVLVGWVSLNTGVLAEDILRLQIKGQALGVIDIRFNEEMAPQHVERIKRLTKENLYDGIVFHRVIPNFMAQTGDVKYGNFMRFEPTLVGMGGSDYPMLREEFSTLPFVEGTVGMARSQDPNSANSQFFIMFEAAPHLNGKYTVVGEVVSGMDVVKAIKKGTRAQNGSVAVPDYIFKADIIKVN